MLEPGEDRTLRLWTSFEEPLLVAAVVRDAVRQGLDEEEAKRPLFDIELFKWDSRRFPWIEHVVEERGGVHTPAVRMLEAMKSFTEGAIRPQKERHMGARTKLQLYAIPEEKTPSAGAWLPLGDPVKAKQDDVWSRQFNGFLFSMDGWAETPWEQMEYMRQMQADLYYDPAIAEACDILQGRGFFEPPQRQSFCLWPLFVQMHKYWSKYRGKYPGSEFFAEMARRCGGLRGHAAEIARNQLLHLYNAPDVTDEKIVKEELEFWESLVLNPDQRFTQEETFKKMQRLLDNFGEAPDLMFALAHEFFPRYCTRREPDEKEPIPVTFRHLFGGFFYQPISSDLHEQLDKNPDRILGGYLWHAFPVEAVRRLLYYVPVARVRTAAFFSEINYFQLKKSLIDHRDGNIAHRIWSNAPRTRQAGLKMFKTLADPRRKVKNPGPGPAQHAPQSVLSVAGNDRLTRAIGSFLGRAKNP